MLLEVINGHVEIVRALVQAGADTELRGSGAPGFFDKNATDLAAAQGRDEILDILRDAPQPEQRPADGA